MSNQYPKTSQFESTSSILHLPANYEAALVEVTSESLVALGGLESWVADFEQSGMSLEGFTSQRSQLIGDTFSDTTRAVSGIINSAPGILDGLRDFSQTDRTLWANARADYTYNPAASLRLIRHLASSTNAGDKFEAEVRKNDATTNQQRGTGSSSQSGGQNRQQRDSRQDRQRQSASSSRENSRAPNAYDELMTTLRNAEDRGLLSTIRGFERTEVAKVIATVKHLRKNNP